MRIVRPVVRTVGEVGHRVRDLGRLQEVARVLVRHGLGLLLRGVEIPGLVRPEGDTDKVDFETLPERMVAALQELGPTYVKLGQVLSTRPDILPQRTIDALQVLQDDVHPLPFSVIEERLEKQLGAGWRERFQTFDESPLATASIAQVHRATLLDGSKVVVKVQRPGIERKIKADVNILYTLARQTLVEFPEAQAFDPVGVLAEFERSILSELSFEIEARNMKRVANNFAGLEVVRVPVVHQALSSKTILVMEFLDGVKIRMAREAGHDMQRVGDNLLRVAYDMLFEHGFFHGDLHPGNVLVLPGEVIGLLDFGMVGRLTQEMRNNVISLIFALQRGDYRTIARLCYDIAIKDDRVDFRAVERATVEIVDRHWSGSSVREMQLGPFVVDLAAAASRHGARIPRSYTMFFKALVTAEGLAKAFVQEVDPIAAAEPYVRRFLRERVSEDRFKQDLFYTWMSLSSLLDRLPISLSQLLDDVESQRLMLLVREPEAADRDRAADRRTNRTILAAFAVTCLLGGALVLPVDALWYAGVPVPSLLFWMAGLFQGTVVLAMVFRNRG